MERDDRPGLADRAVDFLARLMDRAGLSGTRFRWRWNRLRSGIEEQGLRAILPWPSARSRHRVCPTCKALVPRSAWLCPACGAGLAHLRAAGIGRAIAAVIPGATTSPAVILLVNGLMFALVLMTPAGDVAVGGFARLLRLDGASLMRYGAGFGPLTFGHGEWWRLITPVFLHGGLLHILFNSMVLLQLGPLVEEEYGTERFVVVYLICGVAGNLASQGLRGGPTVGASSAIVGLMGFLLIYGWRRGGVFGRSLNRAMTEYAIYVLIMSFLPGVDLLAHAGGFAAGAALGGVVPPGPFRSRATARLWSILAGGALALTLVAFYLMARHGAH